MVETRTGNRKLSNYHRKKFWRSRGAKKEEKPPWRGVPVEIEVMEEQEHRMGARLKAQTAVASLDAERQKENKIRKSGKKKKQGIELISSNPYHRDSQTVKKNEERGGRETFNLSQEKVFASSFYVGGRRKTHWEKRTGWSS